MVIIVMVAKKIFVFCVDNPARINMRTRYTGPERLALPELLYTQRARTKNADAHTPCYRPKRETLFCGHFKTKERNES